ncbi:large ribosomal subunit protein mL66 [Parasteatoda tepidariorum]|uniref:large ribosomal subunit protein mL66 n=1 Tax=Parasteatoda tepidariorum TaxID=114398 RepID=UPI00077FA668|nr:39S ribosomal protein S18a, mitochondrial [Parasteatoda tepidariorum]
MGLKLLIQFVRDSKKLMKYSLLQQYTRPFSISSVNRLKEIVRTETENQIVIEGVKVKSEREGKLLNLNRGGCPLCKLGLKNLKHSDILIISQFINSDGTLIPQHITGLCNKQHFRVRRAVALAQRAGLIPKSPGTPIFGDWEKYNTYFKKF